jgi:hypothetical protein
MMVNIQKKAEGYKLQVKKTNSLLLKELAIHLQSAIKGGRLFRWLLALPRFSGISVRGH